MERKKWRNALPPLDEVNGNAPEWFLKINMGCFFNLLKYCIFVEAISNVSNKRS